MSQKLSSKSFRGTVKKCKNCLQTAPIALDLFPRASANVACNLNALIAEKHTKKMNPSLHQFQWLM